VTAGEGVHTRPARRLNGRRVGLASGRNSDAHRGLICSSAASHTEGLTGGPKKASSSSRPPCRHTRPLAAPPPEHSVPRPAPPEPSNRAVPPSLHFWWQTRGGNPTASPPADAEAVRWPDQNTCSHADSATAQTGRSGAEDHGHGSKRASARATRARRRVARQPLMSGTPLVQFDKLGNTL